MTLEINRFRELVRNIDSGFNVTALNTSVSVSLHGARLTCAKAKQLFAVLNTFQSDVDICTFRSVSTSFERIVDARALIECVWGLNCKTLVQLYFANHRVDAFFGRSFARLAHKECVLQDLDLENNALRYEHISILAQALCSNSTLRELHLNFNEIGNDGAIALADALKVNATLRALTLAFNCIEQKGAAALAFALRQNCTLNVLCLQGNVIGSIGWKQLICSLRTNRALHTLNLPSMCDMWRLMRLLVSVLRRFNCTLETLYIDNRSVKTLENYAFLFAQASTLLTRNKAIRCRTLRWKTKIIRLYRIYLVMRRASGSLLPPFLRGDFHGATLLTMRKLQ